MDFDTYLTAFERTATQNYWCLAVWAVRLQASLTGKLAEAAAIVPIADNLDYDLVKEAIQRIF